MARYFVLFAAFVTIVGVGRRQSDGQSSVQSPNTRTVSVYTGLGFLEILAVGVQYQINDEFALGVKTDVAMVAGGDLPQGGGGGGFKGSYFFSRTGEGSFLSTNVLNMEASYLATGEGGAVSLEATIGHDSIEGRGIGLGSLCGTAAGFVVAAIITSSWGNSDGGQYLSMRM